MQEADPGVWDTILKYGWTGFLFLFGLQRKANQEIHGRISNLKDTVAEHKLSTAKEYATKDDHKDMISEIRRGFDRIEKKLDGKVDK